MEIEERKREREREEREREERGEREREREREREESVIVYERVGNKHTHTQTNKQTRQQTHKRKLSTTGLVAGDSVSVHLVSHCPPCPSKCACLHAPTNASSLTQFFCSRTSLFLSLLTHTHIYIY